MTRLSEGTGPEAPRAWTEILLPHFSGAGVNLVESALFWVIRDWCREGLVWVERLPNLEISSTQVLYVLPSPYAGVEIGFVLAAEDERGNRYWPHDQISAMRIPDRGRWFNSPQPGLVEFPINTVATIGLIASLVPMTTNIPQWMRVHHQNHIENGVIGRMLRMPNRPWTSVRDGEIKWREYLGARSAERERARASYTAANQRWSFPRFGV